jgi:hypothetical protein
MVLGTRPSQGELAMSFTTGAPSFGIKEHRIGDGAEGLNVAQVIDEADDLSVSGAAIVQEAKREGVAQRWRIAVGGGVALGIDADRLGGFGEQMRAGGERVGGCDGDQTDEFLAIFDQAGTRGHCFADAILFGRDHAGHADIKGGDTTVDFGVGDTALFAAQHVERRQPVGTATH